MFGKKVIGGMLAIAIVGSLVASGTSAEGNAPQTMDGPDNGVVILKDGCMPIPARLEQTATGNCAPGAVAFKLEGSAPDTYDAWVYSQRDGDLGAMHTEVTLRNGQKAYRASFKEYIGRGTLEVIHGVANGYIRGLEAGANRGNPQVGGSPESR